MRKGELTDIKRHIEVHRVEPATDFNKGWFAGVLMVLTSVRDNGRIHDDVQDVVQELRDILDVSV